LGGGREGELGGIKSKFKVIQKIMRMARQTVFCNSHFSKDNYRDRNFRKSTLTIFFWNARRLDLIASNSFA
jgi:hypothetical protein